MPFVIHPLSWIWIVSVTAVCAAALWRGGPSERVAGITIYAGWLASIALMDRRGPGAYAQWAIFGIDALLLAVLLALAMRSHRFWPMAAAGFHFLTIITHAARVIDPTFDLWVYLTAEIVWGYLMLIALASGVLARWREHRILAAAKAPPRET